MGRPFVIICVATSGHPHWKFWDSVEKMRFVALKAGIDNDRMMKRGCYVDHNRNLLVSDGLKRHPDATHLLFIDDDMTYPADMIVRLVAADKDVCLAQYFQKTAPYMPIVAVISPEGGLMPVHVRPPAESMVRMVSTGGTGAMLIKRNVFGEIPFPWFKTMYDTVDHLPAGVADRHEGKLIEGHVLIGEDTWFCSQVQAAGFRIYCDFSLVLGHIDPDREITYRDYEAHHERDAGNDTHQG